MMRDPPRSAIVLGAGIGGLAAAAALRRRGEEVVIVERDRLPGEPGPRAGVPQSDQLHNLLGRAQMELEQLLPGFCQALGDAGAGRARVSLDPHVRELGIAMPERDLKMFLICADRPIIEHTARRLLLAGGGVSIVEQTRAEGLEIAPDGSVAGVRIRTCGGRAQLPARLVVDATGTTSRAPHWLTAAGREAPEVETRLVAQWYVTTRFRRGPLWRGRDEFWMVFPSPPHSRGALVSPSGPDEWCVSVSGRDGDPRPQTPAEVRSYAASLESSEIAGLLRDAEAVSVPTLFRKPTWRWRHYERIADPAPGLLPLGDSIASLNPLFGQGMSVAAWQAGGLAKLLGDLDPADSRQLRELTRAHLNGAAAIARAAIRLGEEVDMVAFGEWGPNSAERERFARSLIDQPDLHRAYVRVWHLLEPASVLGSDRV